MMSKRKKLLIILLGCAALLCASVPGGAEVVVFDEPVAVVTEQTEVTNTAAPAQQPDTTTTTWESGVVYTTEEATSTQQAAPEAKTYRVTFFDLEGGEIMSETLREGETVQKPALVPERAGLVFQYWYDLFTYDQVGTPAPFVFGGTTHRNLNLVPYYHYASVSSNTVEETGTVDYGERMVVEVSDQLMLDILVHEVRDGSVSITEIPSVIHEDAAKTLLAEILRETPPQTEEEAPQPTDIVSEDAPQESVGEPAWPTIEEFLDVSFENAPQEEADGLSVMSREQVNLLIDEILADGGFTYEPAVTEPESESEPEEEPQPQEEPLVAIPDATANALMEEILFAPASVDVLAEELQAGETQEQPRVEVVYTYDGELTLGTLVTMTANVYNIDPALTLTYQWENDASGSFQPVPGAVGRTHTFVAEDSNTDCTWRVNINAE